MSRTGPRSGIAALLLVLALAGLSACGGGGSGDTGAEELAHQRELSAARSQAAQDARQATKIKDLERELHQVAHHQKREARKQKEAVARTATSEPTPAESPPPAEPQATGDWPGGSGFTAILASVSTEAEARSIQAEATGRGLDAGVLFSSDYSSLRPGYWVVFSGAFPNAEGAEARMSRARELGYSEAYPRFVAP